MDTMNQPAQAPMPEMPVTHKKGNGLVVTIVVLLLLILAAYLLWPAAKAPLSSTASTPATQQQQAKQAQANELNSLQADVDATNVDGVSNSL